MSVMTIGLMGDLGYTVNFSAAQTYVKVFTTSGIGTQARIDLGDDVIRIPIEVVDDRSGRVLRVINP